MQSIIKDQLAVLLSKTKVSGEGRCFVPDNPIPAVTKEDMVMDAQSQYTAASSYPEDDFAVQTAAWIRRAVHAELFAKALEADLEKLRNQE
jgi:hypothetical protein